jgi:hypothetical protein
VSEFEGGGLHADTIVNDIAIMLALKMFIFTVIPYRAVAHVNRIDKQNTEA